MLDFLIRGGEGRLKEKVKRVAIFLGSIGLILTALLLLSTNQLIRPATITTDFSSIIESIEPLFESAEASKEPFVLEEFLSNLPQFSEEAFVVLNNDVPLFTTQERRQIQGVSYSELDDLGRCGVAVGRIGPETLATEERGAIGEVKPSGWHTVRYDDRIEDRYLYNRCHLIGYQLAGDNAEPRNLITGTRYLNMTGMLPFENAVWAYITETGNHVLYRITPVFAEDNLVASGVLMEAYSIEDNGTGIQFFDYLFNVQPGIIIDYKTGDSWEDDTYQLKSDESDILILTLTDSASDSSDKSIPLDGEEQVPGEISYVFNTNTMRFHYPWCQSVDDMKEKNKAYFSGTRDEAIELGYKPCGRCNP